MMSLIEYIIIILQHIIIGVIGSVGNIFVLIVYIKRLNDNEISTLFIVYLAITDLTCCLILVPINCYTELVDLKLSSDFLCKLYQFLSVSIVTYSCVLMTLVAFERYFSIIWPLHKIINKFRAKILTTILLVFCLLIAFLASLGVGIDHLVERRRLLHTNLTENYTEVIFFENYTDDQRFVSIERTDECFHNDLIIKRDTLQYIRLLQNLLLVICFFIIFVLYASIYISVSKRREMKKNRATYYKQIVRRSRQFSSANNHTTTTLAHNRASIATYLRNGSIRQSFLDVPNNETRNNSCASLTHYAASKPLQQTIVLGNDNKTRRQTHQPVYLPVFDGEDPSSNNHNEFEMEPTNLYNQLSLKSEQSPPQQQQQQEAPNETYELLTQNNNNLVTKTTTVTTTVILAKPSDLLKQKNSLVKTNKVSSQHSDNNNNNTTLDSNLDLLNSCKANNEPNDPCEATNSHRNDTNQANDRHSEKNDDENINSSTLMANIKTAFMLFIVTVIMAIVYTPALLISFNLIRYNKIYWNLYLINNACNPIVYSFLNANFRNSLKHLFCGSFIRKKSANSALK